ncbi:MAG: hypothetical protein ACREGC_04090 [Minisyncoccia bacterium]
MTKSIKIIIDWLYEKKLNGSLSRFGGEVLNVISLAKFIDGMLFVGSNNGLAPLWMRAGVPNSRLDIIDGNADKLRTVFQKASVVNIGIFETKKVDFYQYDLVYFEKEQDDLEFMKTIAKQLLPDAFVIFAGHNPSDEVVQCFTDLGIKRAKPFIKTLIGDLVIIKL